ncbi:MAG: small multi-drug export protein [Desulfurococcales archaeon]|nr:small multi-drug export protein [Desulfurococcales archaeon]
MLRYAWELMSVFLASLTPAVEVRGSIPLTYYFFSEEPSMKVIGVAVAVTANLLIAPVVLSFLDRLNDFLTGLGGRFLFIRNAYVKVVGSARAKGRKYVGRWGYVGLALFVAVPLPGSGAWTGSLIAYLFGLKYRASVLSIEVGVLAASAIITFALEAGLHFLGFPR